MPDYEILIRVPVNAEIKERFWTIQDDWGEQYHRPTILEIRRV